MINNLNFNHRIVLQKEEQQTDESGEIKYIYVNIAQVWGEIIPINLSQNFAKMKRECEITHNISIKYFEGAKKCKKIIFGNRVFNVIGVFCQDEKNEFLTFTVKEIV